MAVTIRNKADATLEAFAKQLEPYATAHPTAEVELYRQNQSSVRVRIIDPGFKGKTRSERHRSVWPVLYQLPEDTLNQLTMLLLISPEETETSMVNWEFEDPLPSRL